MCARMYVLMCEFMQRPEVSSSVALRLIFEAEPLTDAEAYRFS